MIRSSRLAEPQFAVALEIADPRAWDSIAGTLIEAIAAASESTTRAFWDLVFCRILTISAISVNVTANALTISASATNTCRFISLEANLSENHRIRKFLIGDVRGGLIFSGIEVRPLEKSSKFTEDSGH